MSNEQPDAPERQFTSVIEVDSNNWVVNIGALGIKMFDKQSDAESIAMAINQQIEGLLRADTRALTEAQPVEKEK